MCLIRSTPVKDAEGSFCSNVDVFRLNVILKDKSLSYSLTTLLSEKSIKVWIRCVFIKCARANKLWPCDASETGALQKRHLHASSLRDVNVTCQSNKSHFLGEKGNGGFLFTLSSYSGMSAVCRMFIVIQSQAQNAAAQQNRQLWDANSLRQHLFDKASTDTCISAVYQIKHKRSYKSGQVYWFDCFSHEASFLH